MDLTLFFNGKSIGENEFYKYILLTVMFMFTIVAVVVVMKMKYKYRLDRNKLRQTTINPAIVEKNVQLKKDTN